MVAGWQIHRRSRRIARGDHLRCGNGKRAAACSGHKEGTNTLAWSSESKTLATDGFDGQVRLYEAAGGRLAREFVPVPLDKSAVEKAQR